MRYAPRLHRQENGRGFVTGREQKACPFSESGGRYISPRPPSFVPRRAGTKCPEVAERRASVKAETSRLAPGLDRRPSPRLQVGKGGQAPAGACPPPLSAWGRSLPKSKRGGQAPLGLARLDYPKARPGGAVNGGALVRRSS